MKKKISAKSKSAYTGAIVLGMHDALVSVTGIAAGLSFALTDSHLIILTAAIASAAASLSMGASSYLAERTNGNSNAIRAGIYTGIAYCITAVLQIIPFGIIANQYWALASSFTIAIAIIFAFNLCAYRLRGRPFIKRFLEMLMICLVVSIVAFAIGLTAKHFLGIDV
jgi:VIT1/CCC1 family predicted Fe2+/Mn2+ transporter